MATVPQIRDLDPTRNVPYEFITREQFIDDLVEILDDEVPVDVREAEERLYKRLGLLPADADLDALVQELYGAQVLAYYQPKNGHFYLIGHDGSLSRADKLVVAHEYTHALQDQHFDLNDMVSDNPSQGDAAAGRAGGHRRRRYADLAAVDDRQPHGFEDRSSCLLEGSQPAR